MSKPFSTPVREFLHNPCMGKSAQIDEDETTLAGRLGRAMRDRRSNPNQLAIALGMTRQTFYAVMSGRTKNLSWPTLVKASKELHVRPEWLNDGTLPMYPQPALNDEEIRLVEAFKLMSGGHQRDLLDIAQRWADEDEDGAGVKPGFRPRVPRQ